MSNSKFHINRIILILCIGLMVSLSGCGSSIKQVFTNTPAYEAYIAQLEKAKLKDTPMAQAWITAGQRVFQDSILLNLPHTESGYFSASTPEAHAYRFEVKEGQVLTISGKSEAKEKARLFLDLFITRGGRWERVQDAVVTTDSSFQLVHEFSSDTRGLLRLQPELLVKAFYIINLSPGPALDNPVAGAGNRAFGSLYGVDREGGRRRHEGVDIFAPKGTPVVAPTNGYISRVGTSNLGGKVVWMQDQARAQVYYFAHLDSQLVQSGKRVMQGDTLGLVGNTGNARTTPPHLHFGIYQRGSKDPIHYLRKLEVLPEAPPLDTTLISKTYKLIVAQGQLRAGPGTKHAVLHKLAGNTYLEIIGHSGDWYRIKLPNQQEGFVHKSLVAPVKGESATKVSAQAALLSEPAEDAVPITYLQSNGSLLKLAQFGNFQFVETPAGLRGWIREE